MLRPHQYLSLRIISSIIASVFGLMASQVIQAQGTMTYLSNLGQSSTGSLAAGSDSWLAAGFQTGTNNGGYVLNSIQLAMNAASGNPTGFKVMLYADGVIAGGVPFWEMDQASLETVMDVNLGGAMRLFQAALPSMVASGEPGRLVAISSAAGLVGIHHATAYVAAKHGVIGLVRGLASDLSGTGITVNAVCPGSTDTAILEASASMYEGVESVHDFGHQVPLGRLLHANEPAALICFLASPAASGITGAALAVDGGMTAI